MVSNVAPSSPKKRGTIIVDSSTLLRLVLPSKHQFISLDDKGHDLVPRFSDLLLMLSKHGYRIVIPEMVAFEAGQVFHDGRSVSRDFEHAPHLSKLFNEGYEFLSIVGRGGYLPNIEVVGTPDKADSPAADFMRRLDDAHRSELDYDRHARLKELRRMEKKDFGEIAAADLIKHMPLDGQPVFYLSDDGEARTRVHQAARERGIEVGQLNLRGFLAGLNRQGLVPVPDITEGEAETVLMEIQRRSLEYNKDTYPLGRAVDSSRDRSDPKDFPFMKSLDGIKAEIAAEKAQSADWLGGDSKRHGFGSRARAFAQKFGSTSKYVDRHRKPASTTTTPHRDI
jgi:hypothetical protein